MTCVLSPTRPLVLPDAMDDAFLPLSLEATTIAGKINALAINDVVAPLALVDGSINPIVATGAILLPIPEEALVACTLDPRFHAVAILQVVSPLPPVGSATLVVVDAVSTGPVHVPLADEDVPIAVLEPAIANCAILRPLALVSGSVRPNLSTKAVPLVALPLPDVDCATPEGVLRPCRQWLLRFQHGQLFGLTVKVAGRPLNIIFCCLMLLVAMVLVLLVGDRGIHVDVHIWTIIAATAALIRRCGALGAHGLRVHPPLPQHLGARTRGQQQLKGRPTPHETQRGRAVADDVYGKDARSRSA
mmetsp:Transcript_140246/g.355764  ORF Transcript_140246/g.355764 Transcript_140246/m.355764 type:complete len:303 (-) Transcript_140246:7-915(-)